MTERRIAVAAATDDRARVIATALRDRFGGEAGSTSWAQDNPLHLLAGHNAEGGAAPTGVVVVEARSDDPWSRGLVRSLEVADLVVTL